MKIGIIGTGAVGGYFGAKLKLSGVDVAFLSKGANLEAMKEHGLTLETLGETHTIRDAVFTNDPEDLGKLDYIFFTVKSYDTTQTANQIKRIVGKDTCVITPQNGINNDVILGEILGKEKIVPALAQIGASVPKPGYIKHVSLGILKLGEYTGEYSARIKVFESLLKKAGVEVIVSNQINTERWKKYTWNCTFNIIAAITGLRLDQILSDNYLRDLCKETILEIEKIAESEGLNFGDEDFVKARMDLAEKLGSFKPSTLEDLEKGKRIELDSFTGTVIDLGKKHKISTPINNVLYALLHGIVGKS